MNQSLRAGLTAALVGARASIDAALHMLEADADGLGSGAVIPEDPAEECDHPLEERQPLDTFGTEDKGYKCGSCLKTVKPGE